MTFMDSLLKTKWKKNMSNETAEGKILHERKWVNVKKEITDKFQKNKMGGSVSQSSLQTNRSITKLPWVYIEENRNYRRE